MLDRDREREASFQRDWIQAASMKRSLMHIQKMNHQSTAKDVDNNFQKDEEIDIYSSPKDRFAGYHIYTDHQIWPRKHAMTHSNIAHLFSVGRSYHGREQVIKDCLLMKSSFSDSWKPTTQHTEKHLEANRHVVVMKAI